MKSKEKRNSKDTNKYKGQHKQLLSGTMNAIIYSVHLDHKRQQQSQINNKQGRIRTNILYVCVCIRRSEGRGFKSINFVLWNDMPSKRTYQVIWSGSSSDPKVRRLLEFKFRENIQNKK